MNETEHYGLPLEDARFISLEDMVSVGFKVIDSTMKSIADAAGNGGGGSATKLVVANTSSDPANLVDITQQNTFIAYTDTSVDDADGWDVASPTRITAPVGATRVRLTAIMASYTPGPAPVVIDLFRGIFIKNGAVPLSQSWAGAGVQTVQVATFWSPCAPGDYFELIAEHNGDGVTAYVAAISVQAEFA
jgi:hypothetical protein